MTRKLSRVALAAAIVAGAVAGVVLLTAMSSASAGPLATALDRVGALVASLEHRLAQRVGNRDRSAALTWLAPYRDDVSRLRHPDVLLLGAYDGDVLRTLEGVERLERSLGTTLPLVQFYTAWGDKPDQRFPLLLATAIVDMGSIPVITWEPWLTDFENGRHPQLPLREMRDRHGMAAVAQGDYDFYIDEWAKAAAAFGRPFFLRFAHEFNDPYRYPWGPQNNTNLELIAAWKHVVARFRLAGASKVLWVWSPHVAYEYWETYFPGADYVDWVASGALNFGTVAHWSQWWTFRDLFGLKYDGLAAFGKPVMIVEFGSLAVGGDRATWYREALTDLPRKHTAVKALLFFHTKHDQTVTYQQVDWSVDADPALAAVIASAIQPWQAGVRPR